MAENIIFEATKPISTKRMEWLATILTPTEFPSDLEIEFRRKAVGILSDISDRDVECLLRHTQWGEKITLEQSMGQKHFIAFADVEKLQDHELFMRRLENEQLDIHRSSLLEKRLIEDRNRGTSPEFNITELGRLFVYILTNEYPRE